MFEVRPLSIRRAFLLGINSMWESISEKRQCSAKNRHNAQHNKHNKSIKVSGVAWIPHVSSRYMQRIRGPTVSLGVVEPREFDVLAPAAQDNVLLCVLWKYDTWYFEKVLRINY